ncbi:MAG TPA: hypothetical protein VIJ28_00180, partial [Chloroflexota bacterium]
MSRHVAPQILLPSGRANEPRGARSFVWLMVILALVLVLAPPRAVSAADGTVAPTLVVAPAAGAPLTPVTVSGQGYPPGATVTFTFSEAPVAPLGVLAAVVAGADGTLPALQLTIPASATRGGVGLISALWAAPPGAPTQAVGVAGSPFVVTPADRGLTATPNAAAAGTSTVIGGTGFQPNTPLQVALTDASGVVIAAFSGPSSTSTGALLPISVAIPLTATSGLAVINTTDSAGNLAGTPVVILPPEVAGVSPPALVVNPSRAVAGETVQFSAAGLPPHAPITFTLSDATGIKATQTGGASLVTDGSGQVRGTFVIPDTQAVAGDSSSLSLTPANGFSLGGNEGTLLEATLQAATASGTAAQVAAPLVVAGPRLEIFPSQGTPSQPFTVIGTGFGAGEQVTVTQTDASGVITQVGIAHSSDGGVFTTSGQNPSLPAAVGPTATQAAAFTVTATGEPSGLVASARLAVRPAPSIALTPYVAAPGQEVTISGAAFLTNSTLTVRAGFVIAQATQSTVINVSTDASGDFTVPIIIPTTAPTGPATLQVSAPDGATVTVILTVSNQTAAVRVSPLAATPGQSLTVQGLGFASGEIVDLFLARSASPTYIRGKQGGFVHQSPLEISPPAALPGSLRTVAADAQGSFAVSYPFDALGTRPQAVGYLLAVRGETSSRLALTAFGIAGTPPTLPGSGSPPAVCQGSTSRGPVLGAGGSVQYFQGPRPGSGGHLQAQDQLLLTNTGDQSATVTVAYLGEAVQRGNGSPLAHTSAGGISVRTVTFALAAHALIARQVQKDGGNRVVGIIVRAQPASEALDANGCPTASLTGLSATGTPQVRALVVTNRMFTPAKGGSPLLEDAAITNAVGQVGSNPGVSGEDGPATRWYFAEGAVGGAYAEELSFFNPQDEPARVQVREFSSTGQVGAGQTLTVAPFGQGRINPRPPSCGTGKTGCVGGIGIAIQSTVPIVTARILAWGVPRAARAASGPSLDGAGYDLSPGTSQPMRQQFIPYASTAHGDHAELALLNPTGCPAPPRKVSHASATSRKGTKTVNAPVCGARVEISAYTAYGARVTLTRVTVGGARRLVLPLARVRGGIGVNDGIYALSIQSSTPVVAELAQYVGGGPGDAAGAGAHPGFEELGVAGATQISGAGLTARGGLAVR